MGGSSSSNGPVLDKYTSLNKLIVSFILFWFL